MKHKVWVVKANTVYDADGNVFSDGFVKGVFSSYRFACKCIDGIVEDYTRKRDDYEIEECIVDGEL